MYFFFFFEIMKCNVRCIFHYIMYTYIFFRPNNRQTNSTLEKTKNVFNKSKEKEEKPKVRKNFVSIKNVVSQSSSKQEGKRKSNILKTKRTVKKIKKTSV